MVEVRPVQKRVQDQHWWKQSGSASFAGYCQSNWPGTLQNFFAGSFFLFALTRPALLARSENHPRLVNEIDLGFQLKIFQGAKRKNVERFSPCTDMSQWNTKTQKIDCIDGSEKAKKFLSEWVDYLKRKLTP